MEYGRRLMPSRRIRLVHSTCSQALILFVLTFGARLVGAVESPAPDAAPEAAKLPPGARPPEPAPPGGMVLPPEAATALQGALGRLQPELKFSGASIERSSVRLTVCPPEGTCFDLVLSHPVAGCGGAVHGPFCVSWQGAAPNEAARRAISRAFDSEKPEAYWRSEHQSDPGAAEAAPHGEGDHRPPEVDRPRLSAFALAPLFVLLPLLLGVWGGGAIRRRGRVEGAVWGMVLWVVPPVLFVGVGLLTATFGVWDLLLAGGLVSVGLFATAHVAATRVKRIPFTISVIGTLALLEVLSRFVLPAPAGLPPAASAHVFLEPDEAAGTWLEHYDWTDQACAAIFDRTVVFSSLRAPDPADKSKRTVVHVGDSLLFGLGVPASERYTTLIEQSTAGVRHVNLGFPSTSADIQWLATRERVKEFAPELVVYNFFPGNDLLELDMPTTCCGGRSVLEYPGGTPTPRCTEPTSGSLARSRAGWVLLESPAPFPVRVATEVSAFARQLTTAFAVLSDRLGTRAGQDETIALHHLEAIVRKMKEDATRSGGRFVAVLMPDRGALESLEPGEQPATRWRHQAATMFRSLEVPTLDPWDDMYPVVQRDGAETYFLSAGSKDPHFNPRGHEFIARWLAPRLKSILDGTPPSEPAPAAGAQDAP